MAKKTDDGLSERQAQVIRAILAAKGTDLNKVLALLAENGAQPDACDEDPFCFKFKEGLAQAISIVSGRPEILKSSGLRSRAGKILDLIRSWLILAEYE